MLSKNDFLDSSFHWIGAEVRRQRYSSADVSINKVKGSHEKRQAYGLSFRNETAGLLGDYIQIAPIANRLLIRPSDSEKGFHLLSNKRSKNSYLRIQSTPDTEVLERFLGDFELKYEALYGVYYIEKEEKQ